MKQRRTMLRIIVFVGVLLGVMFGVSTAAGAWSEGPDPDGIGTHDWILMTAAGFVTADWLDLDYALPFSDDPDTEYNDTLNHIYDVWGLLRMGLAPTAVRTHFNLAILALKTGNDAAASKEVALMAHYYDDIWNPWHTTYEFSNLALQAAFHIPYEDAVWAENPEVDVEYDGFTRIKDAAAATRTAAGVSRGYYSAVAKYATAGYSSTVDTATDTVLRKAVNGLADLIASISVAAGRL